jgi:hypothetical protein
MRHLYEPAAAEDVKARIRSLGGQSVRKWGRMDAAQWATVEVREVGTCYE